MEIVGVENIFLGSENYHIDVCSTSKEMNKFNATHFDIMSELNRTLDSFEHEPLAHANT